MSLMGWVWSSVAPRGGSSTTLVLHRETSPASTTYPWPSISRWDAQLGGVCLGIFGVPSGAEVLVPLHYDQAFPVFSAGAWAAALLLLPVLAYVFCVAVRSAHLGMWMTLVPLLGMLLAQLPLLTVAPG